MNLTLAVRALALFGAPWIAFSVVTQGALSTQAMIADGGSWARGVWQYLCYFTVLTNIFIVLVLARAAWRPGDRRGLNAPSVELMAVTSIVFVGAVYNILLASLWDPQGLQKYNDDVLHIGAPILFMMIWVLRPRGVLNWSDAVFAALWPFGYAIYGLSRGAFDGFYPYFFMNPAETPWPNVLVNMAGLVGVFLVASLLLIGLDRTASKLQPRI